MITKKDLLKLETSFNKKPIQKALQNILYKTNLTDVTRVMDSAKNQHFYFSNEVKTLPVTNQEATGRCWIFAGLNFLREETAKKLNLANFEFSQNYVAFYDKLEKINFFLESINDFVAVDQDDRTLQYLLNQGIQDGGQWQMFVNVVKKYGLVPKTVMPETKSSSMTYPMNKYINLKLRQYAYKARQLKDDMVGLDLLKAQTLDELYTFLSANFGNPPKTFDFEYVDKDQNYHLEKNLTPASFYERFVGVNLDDYISVINSPTNDKPFYKTYTIQYLNNVVEGDIIKHLNLPMGDFKDLILNQLIEGQTVWFGADVAFDGIRLEGIWDDKGFDYQGLFGLDLTFEKGDMLDYRASAMGHAMTITGVNLDDGVPNKWKIQNSWGDKAGDKGYYLASDTWFNKYVYQAVVHKKYLTKRQAKAWDLKPIELKPWDPMGTLAK